MRCNAQFNTKGNTELWSGYIHWSVLQVCKTWRHNNNSTKTSSQTNIMIGSTYSVRRSLRSMITSLIVPFRFIVLFCNAIREADSIDLKPLTDFVTSLESCRSVSEGADKLYSTCLLLLKVARLYIHAKCQEVSRTQELSYLHPTQNISNARSVGISTTARFDPHLNALGLIPNSAWSTDNHLQNLLPRTQDSYASVQFFNNPLGLDGGSVGYGPVNMNQNSVQDWFSGSRYLFSSMEAGVDLQMPDIHDIDLQ
jgi:hypothetical protein